MNVKIGFLVQKPLTMYNKLMDKTITFQWLEWHFFEKPKIILKAWKNLLKFNLNYFSVFLFLKTFFSPWRKNKWSYGRGFDIKRYFNALFGNLTSRLIGAVMRTFLILFGLIIEVSLFLGGIIILILWVMLPLLFLIGLYFGITIMFK